MQGHIIDHFSILVLISKVRGDKGMKGAILGPHLDKLPKALISSKEDT